MIHEIARILLAIVLALVIINSFDIYLLTIYDYHTFADEIYCAALGNNIIIALESFKCFFSYELSLITVVYVILNLIITDTNITVNGVLVVKFIKDFTHQENL